jgi:FdhE protein
MASLLRKLLGTTRPLPADVQEALVELNRLKQDRPALADLAGELADLLPVLYSDPIVETVPEIQPDRAAEQWISGVPMLRNVGLTLDFPSFRRRWQGICKVLARRRPDARALVQVLEKGNLDPQWHLDEILAGRIESVHGSALSLGIEVSLAASVWWLAQFPVLSHVREKLETVNRQGAPAPLSGQTEHGFCPYCGSSPRFGEFRGLEQTRWLRCLLCAAAWEFPRLRCPFCGTTDHRRLGYLHVEGEENRLRAATCDDCRHHLKMQSTLTALTPPHLLVADLATLHLDLIAADRGYVGNP